MLRTPHRRLLAAVVTTALLLAPAAPALAAPAGATVSAVLVWLQSWLPWPGTGDAQRSTGADENLPSIDPNGLDAAPTLAPQSPTTTSAEAPQGGGGDAYPSMDPDG